MGGWVRFLQEAARIKSLSVNTQEGAACALTFTNNICTHQESDTQTRTPLPHTETKITLHPLNISHLIKHSNIYAKEGEGGEAECGRR